METTTSFDLNQAIQRWRENLAQSPAFRSENLYEIETHLRDSISRLQARELSAEEAFLVATKRIGKSGELETEFGKVNASSVWLDRGLWILIGSQLWSFASNLAWHQQVALSVSLPKINEWLGVYGLAAIPESFPKQLFFVIALPLTILAGAKMFSLIYRWANRRGRAPLVFLLNRPGFLAGAYALLCLLSAGFSQGLGALVEELGLQRHCALPAQSRFTLYALFALQTAVFVAFVLVVARRRLARSKG